MIEPIVANKYIILFIVLIGTIMSTLDGSIVNIAMPTIATYFNVSLADVEWISLGYLVSVTALLLIFGKMSDYFGKTNIFIAGFTIFTLSSLACGLSFTLSQLILFRVIQGIGAAMVSSISGAILMIAFPPNERGTALGYWVGTIGLGLMIGPIVGGNIVEYIGWQYIFFVNVPIGIFLLAAALKYLKIPEARLNKLNMDWIGASLLVLTMGTFALDLGELARNIQVTTTLLAYSILFFVALILFLIREFTCKNPLIDLTILKVKAFILPLISMTIFITVVFCMSFVTPFVMQGVFNMSPSLVGWVSMVIPLIMFVFSPISGRLYDKYGMKNLAPIGISVFGLSLIFGGYATYTSNLWMLLTIMITMGIGCAIFQGPNNTDVMTALPSSKVSIASSITSTSRNFGTVLGVSLASIMITTQLNTAGYTGIIIHAGTILPDILANIFYVTGILCLIATLFSYSRT